MHNFTFNHTSHKIYNLNSWGNVFCCVAYFCACNPESNVALVYPLGRNSIIPLFFRVIENLAKRPHSNYTRRTTLLLLLLWVNSHKYSLPATSVTTGKKINDKSIILLCLVLQTVVFFCTYVRFNVNFSQTVKESQKFYKIKLQPNLPIATIQMCFKRSFLGSP